MTWLLAAAGAAAALVVGVAVLLLVRRRRSDRIGDPDEAAQAADQELVNFATLGAVVGADGAAALAVAESGRVAVVRRRRAGLIVREVAWQALRSTPAGVLVESGDRRFGTVLVSGVNALDVRRLGPARFDA